MIMILVSWVKIKIAHWCTNVVNTRCTLYIWVLEFSLKMNIVQLRCTLYIWVVYCTFVFKNKILIFFCLMWLLTRRSSYDHNTLSYILKKLLFENILSYHSYIYTYKAVMGKFSYQILQWNGMLDKLCLFKK